jgi:hypothetical protein
MIAGLFDSIPEWMTSWYFMGGMIVLLIALIGLLMFLRSRRPED